MKPIGEELGKLLRFPPHNMFEEPKCVTCAECGNEHYADAGCHRCEEAEQRRREAVAHCRGEARRLNIPWAQLEALLEGKYRETEAVKHVRQWRKSNRNVLLLSGGVGTGKTYAAAIAILEHGYGAACKAHDLPMRTDPWNDERDRFDPFPRHGFLVLDDLGVEDANARWLDVFGRWIDQRYGSSDPTLITTNLRRAEIRPRYGDRVADRLNACAMAIELAGGSMRRKGSL